MVAIQEVNVDIRGVFKDLATLFTQYKGPPTIFELMIEGPRGTGKSRQAMQLLLMLAEIFPGSKGLLVRNKRRSMSGTTLVEWEKCFPPGDSVLDGPKPEGRSVYRIGDSTVYVAGLDESDRLRSFTLDWVYYEEGTESTTSEDWESLYGSLRSWKMPFQLLITTVNPKSPGHWLNKRAKDGKIRRLRSTFKDNPVLFDDVVGDYTPQGKAFVAQLQKLTGHRYRRDYLGEWCGAEGLVFPEFDRGTHIIDARINRDFRGDTLTVAGWNEPVALDWYMLSMDFGHRAPGCAQVWGIDTQDRMFKLVEVYHARESLDWWASVVCTVATEFPITHAVADCADPMAIEFLNSRLGPIRGRDKGYLIRGANKSKGKLHGLHQLRWYLETSGGGPRMFMLRDATRYGRQADLVERSRPTCLEEELEGLVWRTPTGDGMVEREEPQPGCPDHAVDAAIYASVYAWNKDLGPNRIAEPKFKPNTYGSVFRYQGEELPWPSYAI